MYPEYPNLYQRARKATYFSQEEAAELLGLSAESMKHYENGRRTPSDDTVHRMAELYNLPWLELEHAKARGAKIYAEVAGYGTSSDAYHITSPAEDGAGAARAMTNAVEDAGIRPEEITYINAHGTSTHHNDLFETRAIKLAFGNHAYDMKVNSTKSMVGHLLGAAGAIEFVTCVKEIQDSFVHATVGYTTPDEELDLDYCKEAVQMDVPYALSNSLGFGGHNASILLKKYSE